MEHSANFDKVKRYFSMKMWSEERVRNAVVAGWITGAEFEEITGEKYIARNTD